VHRFLKQWTLKEAHVKATGRGIGAGHTGHFSICATFALCACVVCVVAAAVMMQLGWHDPLHLSLGRLACLRAHFYQHERRHSCHCSL
jgi:phosphopantetheinyl transferase (holo-ACP synthase)